MPYYTGTANSATDLRNAIVTAATDNGWTWDSTHNMLYKGEIYGRLTISGLRLFVQAALGYSGSTLINPSHKPVGITDAITRSGNTPLSYPLTYHIFVHTGPDDIIVAVNYQVVWWQWLALGQARKFGVAGSGVWHWGTFDNDTTSNAGISIRVSLSRQYSAFKASSGAPFWNNDSSPDSLITSSIHLNFNGFQWFFHVSGDGGGIFDHATSLVNMVPLLATQPNTWNGESVLARLNIMVPRTSGFWSYVAELPHLRMTRNDNISDGQILTIGSEKWFVAPVYRKNTADRDGSNEHTAHHSGTIAMAVRYDGP